MALFILILLGLIGIAALSFYALKDAKADSQRHEDLNRDAYEVVFPKDLREENVQNFLRAIGGSLHHLLDIFGGTPTIAFETWWSDRGIRHVLQMPSKDSGYIISQLEGHIPGVDLLPLDDLPDEDPRNKPIDFTFGFDLSMTSAVRTFRIKNAPAHTTKILKAIQIHDPHEVVVLQWLVAHSAEAKIPDEKLTTGRPTFWQAFWSGTEAPKHEVKDRQAKAAEQQFAVHGRIATLADTDARSQQLALFIVRALQSEQNRNFTTFKARPTASAVLQTNISEARTPIRFSNQMTISEFAAMSGWPLGTPEIPGLIQGSARRIPPTASVATEGRILGVSNVSGMNNRRIALSYDYTDLNCLFAGMIGSGKSVGMSNSFFDDVHNGYGAIIIDASGSRSPQCLSNRGLDYIPPERVKDVVHIDVLGESEHPVGFNPLDQGEGLGAVDQITGVFQALYPDIDKGVSVRDLLRHGVWTLIAANRGLTMADLGPLIRPNNPTEQAWSDEIIGSVKEPDLKEFWERMKKTGRGNPRKVSEWERYTDPLYRRLWQLVGRPEIRHIIGQNRNALRWDDVLTNNKIVIVNMGGLPAESAEILGSLFTQTLWSTAQRLTPDKGNGLYLDEFQVTTNIKEGLADMLNRGRKHKLWTTLGTQFITDLAPATKNAIFNNVGTRVIYRTGADEALTWRRQFASDVLKEYDFQNARPFEAIAQIPDANGKSIVTLKARPPEKTYPHNQSLAPATAVINASRRTFGKPIDEVRQEIIDRRRPAKSERRTQPQVDFS